MAERHTIDFDWDAFNVLTDHDARTITLQFERTLDGLGPLSPCAAAVLADIRRRFGDGLLGRLRRRLADQRSPFELARSPTTHPDGPHAVRFVLAVRDGFRTDSALSTLLEFLRGRPGFRRITGPPLDPDEPHEPHPAPAADASTAAQATLLTMLRRRRSG
ncbi:hypothetical protein OJF2_53490 [Aquisphaera giovannonii]|uniref:Uncharacterized protein n=1 Tax=Aquisphaera giovannonii TaxID=406548 RepID=A0A5B9W8Z9_9BACT|nr:hypothetical protein [Aquisphaera giovannonii]QEH36764.1 hypothetical protein OJF2_53490 [Aquisphaera giovannonii]